MTSAKKILILFLLQTVFGAALPGIEPCGAAPLAGTRRPNQVALTREADLTVTTATLTSDIEFLTSDLCEGRATSQRGSVEAGFWIARRFRALGLVPLEDHYAQSFPAGEHPAHNIVGMIPATRPEGADRYIIVLAHYDNIGTLDGKLYPGADSNASGVAVLLAVAQMFRYVTTHGGDAPCNIVFAALDAKQHSLAGAYALWERISGGSLVDPFRARAIGKEDIALVANLDILGSCSSPVTQSRPDYMIMLGGTEAQRGLLHRLNIQYCTDLFLAYDYYGSPGFTDLFLNRVSDQKPFREHKVPSVMFTSGITMQTNRDTDDISRIDFPVLHRRTRLIFHYLERFADSLAKK